MGSADGSQQQVVPLCCLEYWEHEIAATLDIAYGTTRTHLYKATDKMGINKNQSRYLCSELSG